MSGFKETSREIIQELQKARTEAKKRFVYDVYGLQKGIIQKFYTAAPGSSVGLARRTGAAARSWAVVITREAESITAEVYSAGVPYADMSEKVTITPKSAKWLAIPVNEALTKAGAPRYPDGPNQAAQALRMAPKKNPFRKSAKARIITKQRYKSSEGSRDPLRFYKKNENLAFLIAKDNASGPGIRDISGRKKSGSAKDSNRIMFVLKKKVVRPARTAGLMGFVEKRTEQIFRHVSDGLVNLGK